MSDRVGSVIVLLFELLLPRRKALGVDFLLCLGLWIPGQYEFLGVRVAKVE